MPYRYDSSGIVEWNEVSNTATWGTPGPNTSVAAAMPLRFAGL
jgi:hypothetical protein